MHIFLSCWVSAIRNPPPDSDLAWMWSRISQTRTGQVCVHLSSQREREWAERWVGSEGVLWLIELRTALVQAQMFSSYLKSLNRCSQNLVPLLSLASGINIDSFGLWLVPRAWVWQIGNFKNKPKFFVMLYSLNISSDMDRIQLRQNKYSGPE